MPYSWNPPTDAELAHKAPVRLDHPRRIRDMIRAIAAGDPGADLIVRGALKTATNSVSGTLPATTSVVVLLDAWSFFPHIRGGTSGGLSVESVSNGTPNADTPAFRLNNPYGTSQSYAVAWRSLLA